MADEKGTEAAPKQSFLVCVIPCELSKHLQRDRFPQAFLVEHGRPNAGTSF